MTILDKNIVNDRQHPQFVTQDFDYTELTTAVATALAKIPAGGRVVGGGVLVETVWNSGTSDVLDIGDGADDDRYSSSQIDLTALGFTALDISYFKYTTTDWIDGVWTGTGAVPTTGAAKLFVEYIIDGNGNAGIVPHYA